MHQAAPTGVQSEDSPVGVAVGCVVAGGGASDLVSEVAGGGGIGFMRPGSLAGRDRVQCQPGDLVSPTRLYPESKRSKCLRMRQIG